MTLLGSSDEARSQQGANVSPDRVVGDAIHSVKDWSKFSKLPSSSCLCTPELGCNEDCLNRMMLYECDNTNCALGPELCTNRAFAELKERCKTGRKYDIGVEVVKTDGKGFGIRANRTFEPNQVIVEYAGEIIDQEECNRRMQEEYKDARVSANQPDSACKCGLTSTSSATTSCFSIIT